MSNYYPDADAPEMQETPMEPRRPEAAKNKPMAYSKAQLIASTRYSGRRDALNVLLEDGRLYTELEVVKALDDYYKKKVK